MIHRFPLLPVGVQAYLTRSDAQSHSSALFRDVMKLIVDTGASAKTTSRRGVMRFRAASEAMSVMASWVLDATDEGCCGVLNTMPLPSWYIGKIQYHTVMYYHNGRANSTTTEMPLMDLGNCTMKHVLEFHDALTRTFSRTILVFNIFSKSPLHAFRLNDDDEGVVSEKMAAHQLSTVNLQSGPTTVLVVGDTSECLLLTVIDHEGVMPKTLHVVVYNDCTGANQITPTVFLRMVIDEIGLDANLADDMHVRLTSDPPTELPLTAHTLLASYESDPERVPLLVLCGPDVTGLPCDFDPLSLPVSVHVTECDRDDA